MLCAAGQRRVNCGEHATTIGTPRGLEYDKPKLDLVALPRPSPLGLFLHPFWPSLSARFAA